MNNKTVTVLLFLMGLFAWFRVRVIGMIGISELVCLLISPLLFFQNLTQMRRDGVLTLCWLWLLVCVGCFVAAFYNQTPFQSWIRGLATPLVSFSMLVCAYHLLKKNPSSLRWFFLGWSLTGLFVFIVHGRSLGSLMQDDVQMGFNSSQVLRMYLLGPLFAIPTRCWYTKVPIVVSVILLVGSAISAILGSTSGRSTALIIMAGAVLVYIGGKSVRRMARIRKNFVVYVVLAIGLIFCAKALYSHAAESGWLGEASREKYENQTKGGTSMLKLLMGGRIQFFAGMYCGIRNPIMGYGPWPIDWDNVYGDFLNKYGNLDDYEEFLKMLERRGYCEIPSHSHIAGFWTWYGIAGLILWLYILCLLVEHFRKYVDVVPQWFGIIATITPMMMWNIFFSPYAERTMTSVLMCSLLLARAYARGWCRMPRELIAERQKYLP